MRIGLSVTEKSTLTLTHKVNHINQGQIVLKFLTSYISGALNGINTSMFAYGQTGSGKVNLYIFVLLLCVFPCRRCIFSELWHNKGGLRGPSSHWKAFIDLTIQ